MKNFSFIISDPFFKKSIHVDVNECKTVQNLKQKIISNLGLNDDQFIIDQVPSNKKLSSINEKYVFQIKILNPSDDIKFLFPDGKSIKIKNSSKLTISSVIKALQKIGLFFSDNLIQNSLSFNLWGIKIPMDGFHLQFVPDNIKVAIKFGDTAITLEYDEKKFIFSENEEVKTALSFIKKQYQTESDLYISKEPSNEALDSKYRLKKSEKYQINNKRSSKLNESSNKKSKVSKSHFRPKIISTNSKPSEKVDSKSYTFVAGKKKLSIEFEDGTLLNNEIYDFEKAFSTPKYSIEFEIDTGGKERSIIKENQKIEIFKGKEIYIREKNLNDFSIIECSYQTNQSQIIYVVKMKYESTIKDMKEIIANRFNISEPQNIKIMNSRRILLDVVKIEDIDNIHKLIFLVSLPVKKSTPERAKLSDSMNKSKKLSKKTSKEKCKYFFNTNEDDDVHEIEIESDSTVRDFKKQICLLYMVEDIDLIKVMFAGKDLLDDLYLINLNIGDMPLFVYIKQDFDVLLLTAKSLRIETNSSKSEDDEEEEEDKYEYLYDDDDDEPQPSSSMSSKMKKGDFNDKKESKSSSSLKDKQPKPLRFINSEVIGNLENKKLIGTGGTSSVYRVKSKDIVNPNGKYLALKVLNLDIFKDKKEVKKPKRKWKEDSDDDDDDDEKEEEEKELTSADFERIKQLLKEYELINNLNHPNIIKTFGIYNSCDRAYPPSILLEYYRNTLADSIDDLEEIDLVLIIYEICDAMKYVHKENIIHRDLKPENILLDWNKHAKLCDFGIAKLIDVETQTSTLSHQLGTIPYMAPELLSDTGYYDRKVDVYAFGVILYFIIAKERPKNSVVNVMAGKMSPIPSSFTDLARNLIKKCWSFAPGDRPEFKDIIEMIIENNFMFFKGIKEKEIINLKKRLKLI